MNKDITILYIGGYSRSGSTILDILLSSHGQVFGTGELCYLYDDSQNPERKCTCGKPYPECDFWGDYLTSIDIKEVGNIVRNVECRSSFGDLSRGDMDESLIALYGKIQEKLYLYIAQKSGSSIIIDSSKTTRDMVGRPLALKKYTSLDVKMIHLLKNGLSTTQSYVEKGRNWTMEGYGKNDMVQGLRAIVGWRLANKLGRKIGEVFQDDYAQIKYEDLVSDPLSMLDTIGQLVKLDARELKNIVANETIIKPCHHVGGNRLRLKKDLYFKIGKPSDPDLDYFHTFAFKLMAGKLSRQLGY